MNQARSTRRWRSLARRVPLLGVSWFVVACQPTPKATLTGPSAPIPVITSPEPSTREGSRASALETPALAPPSEQAPGLPQTWAASFQRRAHCEAAHCVLGTWLPDPTYAQSPYEEVPAQAALWVHELSENSHLSIPFHAALELVILPLSGELRCRDITDTKAEDLALGPWSALRAAGAGLELTCAAKHCQAALALVAPGSTLEATLSQKSPRPARTATNRSAKDGTAASRTAPLEIRDFREARVLTWNHGKNRARILFGGAPTSAVEPPGAAAAPLGNGAAPGAMPAASTNPASTNPTSTNGNQEHSGGTPAFSLTLLEAEGSVSIPAHQHAEEWENLLVLGARGALELRGRSYALNGGEAIHIPPRVQHGYAASGAEPMVALQLYTPAGPERRFIQLAQGAEPPRPPTNPAPAAEASE